MTSRTLLPLASILIFVTGVMFGYGWRDYTARQTLKPGTTREQQFIDLADAARLSTTTAAGEFRHQTGVAARSYVASVVNGGMLVGRGQGVSAGQVLSNTATQAYATAYAKAMTGNQRAQLTNLLQAQAGQAFAYVDAKRKNDTNAQNDAVQGLNAASVSLGKFFAELTPKGNATAIANGWQLVGRSLKTALDTVANLDVATTFVAEQKAESDINQVADLSAAAFVALYPAHF